MDYTFPVSREDVHVRGTFTSVLNEVVNFEHPAIFNEDGEVKEEETLVSLNQFITSFNTKLTMQVTIEE